MKQYGVIYERVESSPVKMGVVCWAGILPPSWSKRGIRTKVLARRLANALIIFSFLGLLFIFSPVIKSEIRYRLSRKSFPRIHFSDLINLNLGVQGLTVPDTDFAIIIPKIDAKAKIIANVDPNNRSEYKKALLQGVAHAKGSVLPGMKGNIYLFAHSTNSSLTVPRYNAVFYLLRELEEGDKVIVYFYGAQHSYQVFQKEILSSTDVRYFQEQDKEEILVLQTCWPPGTTLKQLVILAKKPYS